MFASTRSRRAEGASPADAPEHELSALKRIGVAIVGQTALLTALLVYFGWARTRATFAYFGVDPSLLDFSTTDYVLRSANAAYRPLLTLGLVALAATFAHQWLSAPDLRAQRAGALAARGLKVVGAALVGVGVLALAWTWASEQIGSWLPDRSALGFAWLPITLTAGFAVLAYDAYLRAPGGASGDADGARPVLRPRWYALVGLALLSLFWTVSLLAVHSGGTRALALQQDLRAMPEVVILTPDLLTIRGPGVDLVELDLPPRLRRDGRYRFSYTGLRLLAHADGKHFLLPVGWRRGRDRVFEVPDDGRIRLELIAH